MIEKKIDGKTIFNGKVLKLEHDKVLCPNGNEAYREIIRHPGGAAVLCVTKEKKVVLIKQFRYAYNEIIYEIPAGKLEKGEDPKFSAIRELEEETGYKANSIEFLTSIYPTCGYTDEIIYLYLVTDYEITETHFDDDEVLETYLFDLEEVYEMVNTGKIKDAKTICALNIYMLRNR